MGSNPGSQRVRAMLVDDSALVRKVLTEVLVKGGVDVIATAPDPVFAWERMKADWPDVIVLDVEMPRMDGISFLRKIMHERPTPVLMCSTLTQSGAETTLQALAAGAVGIVTKPTIGLKGFLESSSDNLVTAVKSAARANVRALQRGKAAGSPGTPGQTARPAPPAPSGHAVHPAHAAHSAHAAHAAHGAHSSASAHGAPASHSAHATLSSAAAPHAAPVAQSAMSQTTDRVIAIGLSTGGVQAIEAVLTHIPRTSPGIVIVQHMPERFTASLAQRLDHLCPLSVAEARHGERVLNGRALIAPGGKHMRLVRSGAHYVVEIVDGPNINHHKPSVDVLFRSVAQCAGRNAVGLIMTGMGDDGARGLREMHDAGAITAAQDEASCVVFGMPKEAIRLGAVDCVLPLESIAEWLYATATAPAPSAARA